MSTFDELLAAGPVVAPPVYDGFTALIAQRAGAAAVSVPADGTAAQLGLEPGAASVDELVDNVRYVATAVDVPVVADARGVTDVVRAVRGFAQAGAAAVIVDDDADVPADVGLRVIPAERDRHDGRPSRPAVGRCRRRPCATRCAPCATAAGTSRSSGCRSTR